MHAPVPVQVQSRVVRPAVERKVVMNRGLALRYGVYALACGVAAVLLAPPWSLLLLWPALAWLWLGAGYAGLGARVWARHWRPLLWPVQWLVHWRQGRLRGDLPPVEITPGLWFGPRLSALEARRWLPPDVAVLDVAPEHLPGWAGAQSACLTVGLLEGGTPAALDLLVCALFIDMHRQQGVYIQGAVGHGRAPLVAACWLLRRYPRLEAEQVEEMLGTQRPAVRFSAAQRAVLQQVRALQQEPEAA